MDTIIKDFKKLYSDIIIKDSSDGKWYFRNNSGPRVLKGVDSSTITNGTDRTPLPDFTNNQPYISTKET